MSWLGFDSDFVAAGFVKQIDFRPFVGAFRQGSVPPDSVTPPDSEEE